MKYGPNGQAPSSAKYQVGAKGGMVAQAWQYIWDNLSAEEFQDGTALVEDAARRFGWRPTEPGEPAIGKLKPQSIMAHLHRMAAEGFIEAKNQPVETVVLRHGKQHGAKRQRAHFRIPAGQKESAA